MLADGSTPTRPAAHLKPASDSCHTPISLSSIVNIPIEKGFKVFPFCFSSPSNLHAIRGDGLPLLDHYIYRASKLISGER